MVLLSVGAAKADNFQFACAAPTTCSSGSTTLIAASGGAPVNFNVINENTGGASGTAFLAVLVPDGGAVPSVTVNGTTITLQGSASLTSNGTLGGVLNETPWTDTHFSNFADASSQVGVTSPSSYAVYEFDLGAYNSSGNGAGGLPGVVEANGAGGGSVMYGWLENGSGNVLDQTPLSESITVNTPEPETLSLLGIGLLALICTGFIRLKSLLPGQ